MKEKNWNRSGRTMIAPELVARAKAGDQAAFTELYEQTSAELYRSIRAMVRDEDLAWDIQQDTYLRAFRSLDKLETDGAFLSWLRRIAVNVTATVMAKRLPTTFTDLAGEDEALPELPDTSLESQPELALDRQETSRLVREILAGLSEEQQLVLGMRYYEDLSIKEIAELLHLPVGTVKTQLHRGRKRVETEVRALERQGVKLYGLSPLAFLLRLLRRLEPAGETERQVLRTVLSRTSSAGGRALSGAGTGGAALTGASAGSTALTGAAGSAVGMTVTTLSPIRALFSGTLGKLLTAALAAAMVFGGIWVCNRLLSVSAPEIGIYQPTETQALSSAEDPRMTTEQLKSVMPSTEGGEDPSTPTEDESEAEPSEDESEAEPPEAGKMENLFFRESGSFDDSILAAIYNGPFSGDSPTPTVVWNEGEQDRLLIYPRYADSVVSARRIVYGTGEYKQAAEIEEDPVFSTVCGAEDCIGAALERPEDAPCWYLTVQAPDGAVGSWLLAYNSHGTPAYEFLTDGSGSGEDNDNRKYYDEYDNWYTATAILEELGYDTIYFQGGDYDASVPYVLLGGSLMRAAAALPAQSGLEPIQLLCNSLSGGDAAAGTVWENRMLGDTCRLDAAQVHEMYMNGMHQENASLYPYGESVEGLVAWQAEQFAEARLLGYNRKAEEGQELQFDLSGLLVYNHTLAARTVSVSVNGEEAGVFSLTEGDFFTLIPLDYSGLPGDRPVRVELRVLETRFGTPEQALLWLLPFLGSPLSGGR